MKGLIRWMTPREFWHDTRGQDLIEYALMAGFVAVAAGAVMPSVSTHVSTVFSKISSVLVAGGG
jgi:pilus assembly protein Flp/PilA